MQIQKVHELRMATLLDSIKSSDLKEEVPVACAIYDSKNQLITVQRNEVEKNTDSTSHAEILAIKKASKINFHPNLDGYSLYVTLEPCIMCLGAILNSNIKKVIFGAYSDQTHERTLLLDFFRQNYQKIEIIGGVLEKECQDLLASWFKSIRS